VLAALPRPAASGMRWSTPAQWHVTLAFLGPVAETAHDALGAALVEALAAWPGPVEARVGPATERLGGSILCVPVRGLDALAAATRAAIDTVVPTLLDPVPFRGHVTMARARRHHTIPASLAGIPVAGSWTVRAVSLVRSQLDPAGARYTTLVDATVGRSCRPLDSRSIQHRTGVRY